MGNGVAGARRHGQRDRHAAKNAAHLTLHLYCFRLTNCPLGQLPVVGNCDEGKLRYSMSFLCSCTAVCCFFFHFLSVIAAVQWTYSQGNVLQLMAEEQGLEVSLDGFNKCMEQQRERSRVNSPTTPPPPTCNPHPSPDTKPTFNSHSHAVEVPTGAVCCGLPCTVCQPIAKHPLHRMYGYLHISLHTC